MVIACNLAPSKPCMVDASTSDVDDDEPPSDRSTTRRLSDASGKSGVSQEHTVARRFKRKATIEVCVSRSLLLCASWMCASLLSVRALHQSSHTKCPSTINSCLPSSCCISTASPTNSFLLTLYAYTTLASKSLMVCCRLLMVC